MVRAGALYAPGYEFESRRQHNIFSPRLMAGQMVLVHLIEVRILGGKQKVHNGQGLGVARRWVASG